MSDQKPEGEAMTIQKQFTLRCPSCGCEGNVMPHLCFLCKGAVMEVVEITTLRARLKAAEAGHDDMVARNKLLRNRLDLPIERVEGYDAIIKRLEAAEKALEDVHAVIGPCSCTCEGMQEEVEEANRILKAALGKE